MTLNIDEERNKLILIVDDNTFDWLKFTRKSCAIYDDARINFLWQVLTLTNKYSQVELYLKIYIKLFYY